jgi:hypothetical protein
MQLLAQGKPCQYPATKIAVRHQASHPDLDHTRIDNSVTSIFCFIYKSKLKENNCNTVC